MFQLIFHLSKWLTFHEIPTELRCVDHLLRCIYIRIAHICQGLKFFDAAYLLCRSLGKQILEKLGYHYSFVCWLIHKEVPNMSFAIWYRIGFLLSIKNKFVLPIFITFLMYTKAVFIWDQSAKNGHVMLLEYTFHGSYKINMQRERISNLGKEGQVL